MKQKILILIILLTVVMIFFSCGKKTTKPGKATPLPASEIEPGAGDTWLGEPEGDATAGNTFTSKVFVNTGKQKIAAYGIKIFYDNSILGIEKSVGNGGVTEGKDGFVAAANPNDAGVLVLAGFDVYGKGPGKELHLATINWNAKKAGSSNVRIEVDKLTDETTIDVGKPNGKSTKFEIK